MSVLAGPPPQGSGPAPGAADAEVAKSCCAVAYQSDAAALILGESYHPGGLDLTRSLLANLDLQPGQQVLDVASGPGTSALLIAREHDVSVEGVDLGEEAVARATAAAERAGLAERVRFRTGDAERLPFEDASFDAVVCECAFCTFPDKPTAARELARVLKPGGRLGLTDVTVDPEHLVGELRTLAGWVACLADARPLDEYVEILGAAGLRTTVRESHDSALATMVDQIDARLKTFRMLRATTPALATVDFDRALHLTALAGGAVRDGIAGYALLVATRS